MAEQPIKSGLKKINYKELKRNIADVKSKAWLRKRKERKMKEAEQRAKMRKRAKQNR